MIQILKEITEWGDQKVSNGYYHVNSSGYLVGYMPPLGPYKEFKKPIKEF